MAKAIDNLRKQTKTISKQNRTKRRKESMEKYGRTSYSSSDKAYIEGNYKKVASNSAYGYRQGIKNGEIQKGSDNDWLKADSIRKKRTVRANKSWENINPTKTTPKQKYSWFDSARGGSTFKDQMNTGVLDGLQTAKKNQRSGKHISNVLEYIKGGAKDLVVDPLVDTLKNVDRLGSAGMGAILGVAENVENSLKGYDVDKGLAKRNWQSSWETSAKEGWGKGSAEFMNEKDSRMIDKDIAWNKSKGYDNVVKELEELKKNYTKKNAIAGLVNDVIAPIDLGDKAFDLVKGASKGTLKSFKQLKNGTSDLSLAFKKGASDDVFFSSKPFEDLKLYDDSGANKIHNELDRGYTRNVNSESKNVVKQKVATSSQKPFLASFLDTLDNSKVYSGKQRRIDGRTLNKKYTQTKDGYIPQLARTDVDNIVDNVEKVGNNGSRQFNMFGKDGTTKGYERSINSPNNRASKILNSYDGGDIDEFLEKLDTLDDSTYDQVAELAKKHNPWLYEQMIKGADDIDTMAFDGKVNDLINDAYTKIKDKYTDTKSSRKFSNIPDANGKSLLENYNEFNKSRIEESINNPYKKIPPRASISSTSSEFASVVNNYVDEISNITDDNILKKISNGLKGIQNSDFPTYTKVDMLNKYLFGGKEVIRTNLPQRNIYNLLEHLNNVVDIRLKDKTAEFNKKGKFFARSSTDVQFEQKMSDIASYLGVANKAEITEPIKRYQEIRKQRPLTQEEYYDFMQLQEKKKAWDDLYKEVANMGDEYLDYSYEKYGKTNALKGYEDALNEYADIKRGKLSYDDIENEIFEELSKTGENYTQKEIDSIVQARWQDYINDSKDMKVSNHIANREISKVKGSKGDYEISQSPRVEQANLNEVGEISENIKSQVKAIRKRFNLPEVNTPKANIKLTGNQKLRDLPPVQENLKALRRTIEQEVEFMYKNPNEYNGLEQVFKQIKTEYVNGLRQLGVPDDKYFNKVVALQNELKSKLSKTNKNTPLLKMDLQKLARRISKTFDEIDNTVISKLDDISDDVSAFEKFNEKENLREIEMLIKENKKKSTKTKAEKPSVEEIDDILSNYEDINVPHTDLKGVELDMSKYPNANADGVIAESLTDKVSNALSKSDDKIKSHNKAKKESIFEKAFKENNGEKFFYEDNELYDMYKSWLNSWKKGLTVYNPGWHVQNYFQNKGQNYLALGMDAFKPQTDARNMLKEIKGKGNKAKGAGKYSKEELMDYVVNNGVIDGLGEDVVNARGIFPRLETKIDNSKFMQKLGENEQTARLHHFLTQINRGMTPDDALKSVNDTLFDYSKKTNVDKVISDFIDPFWTFHKNNAKLIGKTALENPGKLAQIQRGVDGLGERDENGKQGSGKTFVDDVNKDTYEYRYKQNMLPEFKDVLSFDESDIDSKLNPLIRIAKQLSKGESNFGNEIVDKETADWGEVTKEDALKEIALDLNPFGNGLVKTLNKTKERKDKAKDGKQSYDTTDKQVLLDWINYITGNKGNYYRQFEK